MIKYNPELCWHEEGKYTCPDCHYWPNGMSFREARISESYCPERPKRPGDLVEDDSEFGICLSCKEWSAPVYVLDETLEPCDPQSSCCGYGIHLP